MRDCDAYHKRGLDGRPGKRPDDVEIPIEECLFERYRSEPWWLGDYWQGTGPIIPLAEMPRAAPQLDPVWAAKAFDGFPDEEPLNKIVNGHDNGSLTPLCAVLQCPWKGCYRGDHAKVISDTFQKEVQKKWYLGPFKQPPVWPPRAEPGNCVEQAQGEPPDLEVRGIDSADFDRLLSQLKVEWKHRQTTDKGHGPLSVNEGIDLSAIPLSLCTNRDFARDAAILQQAEEGEPALPADGEDKERLASIADDLLLYLWKLDLTAAYRQLLVSVHTLWMCVKYWDGHFYLDLRCQFGDASMVEAFQGVTKAVIWFAERCIDGDVDKRKLLDLRAADWSAIDMAARSPSFALWQRDRVEAGLGPRQCRRHKCSGYIDDYLGAALGRRFAFGVSKVFRCTLRTLGFPLKDEKEYLPARRILALGGLTSLDPPDKGLSLSPARVLRYSAEARSLRACRSADFKEFESWTCRLISAALYDVRLKPWLAAHCTALKQARRRGSSRVFLGKGVAVELERAMVALRSPARLALFPVEFIPDSSSAGVLSYYFDASSEVGMGAVALMPCDAGGLIAYYFYSRWGSRETWHINVKESLAGFAALRAFHPIAQQRFSAASIRFVAGRGDNTTANANSRKNSASSIVTSEVLRAQGEFILQASTVVRISHVPSKENLSDPLSRECGDGVGLSEFKRWARELGVARFVQVAIPDDISALRVRMVALAEDEARAERAAPPLSRGPAQDWRSAVGVAATAVSWTSVNPFCGLDASIDACVPLGGSSAGGCDINPYVRRLWERRTRARCMGSFTHMLALARAGRLAEWMDLSRALLYVSGAPCIDFSDAGLQRGVDGCTGQLFLDDVELALLIGTVVIIKEIVPGILKPHLVQFLYAALRLLEQTGEYVAHFKLIRCRRMGDKYTTRERVFIVAIKIRRLRREVSRDDLFPDERPPCPGSLVDILQDVPRPEDSSDLDVSLVEWLPARPTDGEYDGLKLIGRYGGSSSIGMHVYDATGPANTQRTGGTGAGLGTGLYWDGRYLRRLSPQESLAVQSFPTSIYDLARALDIPDDEIFRMAGNSIPVLTLRTIVTHVLSLIRF